MNVGPEGGRSSPVPRGIDAAAKARAYEEVLGQLRQLFVATRDPTARMATIAALLKTAFHHFIWVGFYRLEGGALTVGPYQGAPACMVLEAHRGVCWAGVDRANSVLVDDVHDFPGHIVCDERAASEVVIPLLAANGRICGVLDVDSDDLGAFDEMDARCLREIVALVYDSRVPAPPAP